jgi:predicted N-acetyltransferase YhbS
VNVRPETIADYPAIADVNVRAFGKGREALIVSLHRHRTGFDPELSLVAERDGTVIGHALFSAHTIRLLDADVPAVILGPIAVLPEHQGQGIGGALIEEGHGVAAAKGNAVSFLIGHRTYYPRFGYRINAYGEWIVQVPVAGLGESELEETPVRPDDGEALRALWRAGEGAVDFAIDPGTAYMEWVSPNPTIRSVVYRASDEIVGYVRFRADSPGRPHIVLARDALSLRAVAAALARHARTETLALPLHPRAAGAAAFDPATVRPMAAARATELQPGALAGYFEAVERGGRPTGRVIWPVEFDI